VPSPSPAGRLRALITELRPHQWAKNALVLVPSLLAPGVPSPGLLARALLAAFTFSLCASAGYVLNDLLDLEADRAHATKRRRPFASGDLPARFGPPLGVSLVVISFALALLYLPPRFALMLAIYLGGTVTYSLYLKKRLLVDVLALAGLYAHRILSGGVATGIHVSAWLFGFSIFLFMSLAFVKRFVELQQLIGTEKASSREYYRVDIDMVRSMGTASAMVSALVYMLYVETAAVRVGYLEPAILWLVLPVLLFWVERIWMLAGRGQMQEDPVRFAVKDPKSIACGAMIVAITVAARLTPQWALALFRQ